MNEKTPNEIRGAIIWDLLALNVTIILATINTLTYIFTAASVVLLYPVFKDLKKYKEIGDKKIYSLLVMAGAVSIIMLSLLISAIATKNIYCTYSLYAIGSPMLLTMIVFACIDAVKTKKAKNQPVSTEEEETFTVEEVVKAKRNEDFDESESGKNAETSENIVETEVSETCDSQAAEVENETKESGNEN